MNNTLLVPRVIFLKNSDERRIIRVITEHISKVMIRGIYPTLQKKGIPVKNKSEMPTLLLYYNTCFIKIQMNSVYRIIITSLRHCEARSDTPSLRGAQRRSNPKALRPKGENPHVRKQLHSQKTNLRMLRI